MNTLQRWLIVIAIWVFAIGVSLQALHGRYRLPILHDEYAQQPGTILRYSARYNTWTGQLEVTYINPKVYNKTTNEYGIVWKETPTFWIKDLK